MPAINHAQFIEALADALEAAGLTFNRAAFTAPLPQAVTDWLGVNVSRPVLADRVVRVLATIQGAVTGDGPPDAELGGLIYFDETNIAIYRRTDQGEWDAGRTLVGPQGDDAYTVAVADGFTGTRSEWLASLIGPEGDDAFAVAVADGFAGTRSEWLASLIGPQGDDAYAVAVADGFAGTRPEWLASLIGPQGTVADADRGAWDNTTAYAVGDLVTHLGSTWFAGVAHTGVEPTGAATEWRVFAAKGDVDNLAIGDVSGLQPALDGKFDKTGGTLTGGLRGSLDTPLSGFLVPQNPEGLHLAGPMFYNDIAFARLRGASVQVELDGVVASVSDESIDLMLDTSSSFWNFNTGAYSTARFTITNIPVSLSYGSYMGIVFGKTGWRAQDVILEWSDDGGATWTVAKAVTDHAAEYVAAEFSNGSDAVNAFRITISNFASASQCRITSIFAYNYKSDGMKGLYVSRDGGVIYGALQVLGALKAGEHAVFHEGNFDPTAKANVSHTHQIGHINGLSDALASAGGGLSIAAIQTAAFTPEAGTLYPVDSSAGAVALSALLASPEYGDECALVAYGKSWSPSNPVTLPASASALINGEPYDLVITAPASIAIRWAGGNYGFEVSVTALDQTEYREPHVGTPAITSPADGASDVVESPTLTASAFAPVHAPGDPHAASDWQVATDSGFASILVQSADDASNLESWKIPAGNLAVSTTYHARVRYAGATYGDSLWSEPVSFTTAAEFLDGDAQAIIDQMSTPPASARQLLIDDLVTGLKADGLWSKILALWVPAAHDAQAAGLNWKDPAGVSLSPINAPVFTVDEGFKGDGSAAYIDTGVAPSDYPSYATGSASVGVLIGPGSGSLSAILAGVNDRQTGSETALVLRFNGTKYRAAVNSPSQTGSSSANSAVGDLVIATKTDTSANTPIYINGSLDSTGSASTVRVPQRNLFLLCQRFDDNPNAFTAAQLSLAFIGAGLTATDAANLDTRISAYIAGL